MIRKNHCVDHIAYLPGDHKLESTACSITFKSVCWALGIVPRLAHLPTQAKSTGKTPTLVPESELAK